MTGSDDFDVVFIGGGISTAMTLLGLITDVGEAPRAEGFRLKMAVIDDHGELGGGLAYGARGGSSSLIITSLEDFCPEPIRSQFVAWLDKNQGEAFGAFSESGGDLSDEWAATNEAALQAGRYDELYLPRSVFGMFVKDLLLNAVSATEWLSLEHVAGEAVSVRTGSTSTIRVIENSSGQTRSISGRSVVLAIGTPPQRLLFPESRAVDCRFIDQVYEPSISSQLQRLRQGLRGTSNTELMLIGSNATALDVLFNVLDDNELDAMIDRVTVLSPQGRFPHKISERSVDFSARSLEALIASEEPIQAVDIGQAVRADQARAEHAGLNIAEILPAINARAMEALGRCDVEQTQIFAETIGVEIGRVQRRAGGLYSDLFLRLQQSGRLRHVRGKFEFVEEAGAGKLRVFGRNEHGLPVELHGSVSAIINCAGFETLGTKTSSALVRSLISNGIVTVNGSQRGFRVADDFSASPGIYVNGPCLAGNVVQGRPIWHMEHCGRILSVATELSPILAERVLQTHR